MPDLYDYLVIGSGPAGHAAAIRASQLGLRTAMVERDERMLGGVCLNEGCIPAKSLYHSGSIFDTVRSGGALCGLHTSVGRADMAEFVRRSSEAVAQLRKGLTFLLKKNNVDVINGHARFLDGGTARVVSDNGAHTDIKASKSLIASGSAPRSLPSAPFDGRVILSSTQAIRMGTVPRSLLIVGGGAIGAEFASFFDLIGSDVTVVEMEDRILPSEDREVSRRLQTIFRQKGITVLTSSRTGCVSVNAEGAAVEIEGAGDKDVRNFDAVIVSIGRVPSTADLGLENTGVNTDEAGFIEVDARLTTGAGNIYAAGDVLRTPMLAHVASAEGELAAEAAAGADPRTIDYGSVPNAVYTGIEVASIGMTEDAAAEAGLETAVGKQFFKANGRAVASAMTEGFIKVVADRNTRKLLGAHIIGHAATELIHEFTLAKRAGLSVDDIGNTVHAHPTLSESAMDACRSVFGRSLHG